MKWIRSTIARGTVGTYRQGRYFELIQFRVRRNIVTTFTRIVYSFLVKPLCLMVNEVPTVFVSYFIDFVCQAENCTEVVASPEH